LGVASDKKIAAVQNRERGNRLNRLLDRWLGCPVVFVLGLLHHKRSRPPQVRRIGILAFGAMGDALLLSSLLHDLRVGFPLCSITVFASNSNNAIFDLLDGPDHVVRVPISNPWAMLQIIRRVRFDVLIDSGQWARISAILAAAAKTSYSIGFKTSGQWRHWAFDAVVEHSNSCHEIDNFRRLLSPLGISATSLPKFTEEVLRAQDHRFSHPYVVFHPWASGFKSELREWPIDRWAAVAKEVHKRGYHVVVTGSRDDAARAQALTDALNAPSQIFNFAGQVSLRGTASLLLNAAAVVSVNTGVMHMAALLNRPTLALHGPTNPRRWGPLGSSAIVIGPDWNCGCGYLNLGFEYPTSPPDCMSRISIDDVLDKLATTLNWKKEQQHAT
jgi:heptosyltransferase III